MPAASVTSRAHRDRHLARRFVLGHLDRAADLKRCSAEPGSTHGYNMDPGSAAHHAARHNASKTRVNALMALRGIRGTPRRYPPTFAVNSASVTYSIQVT